MGSESSTLQKKTKVVRTVKKQGQKTQHPESSDVEPEFSNEAEGSAVIEEVLDSPSEFSTLQKKTKVVRTVKNKGQKTQQPESSDVEPEFSNEAEGSALVAEVLDSPSESSTLQK